MNKIILTALAVFCFIVSTKGDVVEKEKIQVLKNKQNVYIRSYFSPDKDVVVSIRQGRNGQISFKDARLIDKGVPMNEKSCKQGSLIHNAADDCTPWSLNKTYIGANHGLFGVLELTVKQDGLKEADIGSEWTDAKGQKFYLIKICDKDKIWILSENLGKGEIWKFNTKLNGKELTGNGKKLKIAALKRTQLVPSCRIQKQEYLINGKEPLPDGKVITCDFLDIIDIYDIIAPDSLLDKIIKNPGKNVKFNSKDLDSILTNNIVYRFQPRGACTILHNSTINRKFNLGYMGFIQTGQLNRGGFDTYEYHIPKTVPFELKGTKYDFSGFQDFSTKVKTPLNFTIASKSLADPKNLPDRWIQFLGRKQNGKTKREVAYAIGYSLFEGITRPAERAANNVRACMIYTSNKTYPSAISYKAAVPVGTKLKCLAYRQYFSPSDLSAKASSAYIHKQHDSWVLYLHYHQPVNKDIIKLPANLTGKKVSVIEKTPAVKILSGETVPDRGITVSSENKRGYIVLKIN